jgi:DNA-binding FadR family transcriptional regulator
MGSYAHQPAPGGRRADPVVADLVSRVVSGAIQPGSLLPAEPELVAVYGISRGTLREAIKVLEAKGVVRARQGRGTVVLDRGHWHMLDPLVLASSVEHDSSRKIFGDLTGVRIAIESELARTAARTVSDAALGQMRLLLEEMKQAGRDTEQYLELDIAFHGLVAEASDNPIAQAIMATIQEPLRSMRRISNRIPEGIAMATEFHARIYECLARRDADAAAAAMTEHLVWSRDHVGTAGGVVDELTLNSMERP